MKELYYYLPAFIREIIVTFNISQFKINNSDCFPDKPDKKETP